MRTQMVTRTVIGTEAEVQVVSISATEISTIKVTVNGTYEDSEKLLKVIKKQTETDDLKVLKVISTERIEKCYGMTQAEFIKLAKELDLKTRKALESADGEDDDEDGEEPAEETAEPETTGKKKGGKR